MNKANSTPTVKDSKMKNINKIIVAAVIATTVVACAPPESQEAEKVETVTYPKVTFHTTEAGPFHHYFSTQGFVDSDKSIMLTPETGGLIRTITDKEGQEVPKGHTVATFDAAIVASNIKELEEQMKLAEYNYNKQKSLYDQGVGTEFALKQAEGQLNSMLKTLQTLKTQAGKFSLRTPFKGYLEQVFPMQGEMAGPGTPIARLINLDEVYVTADISEIYLNFINKNDKAIVSFSALDDVLDSLEISQIGKYVNPANRTVRVKVKLPRSDKYIPNLVATIKIRDYYTEKAITVPSSTISQDAEGNDVILVANKLDTTYMVKSVVVTVGKSYKGMTEILTGLDANMLVVHKGSRSVYDGLEVEELKQD